ncbi:MAG: TIGR01777 family protein [Lewinellaceae bacterium]|nr:TIGR01777 family protein [Lewinellaceae bacterium]
MLNLTILIAGGSGMIGTRLTQLFRAGGHKVRILSRHPGEADEYAWDPAAGTIDDKAVAGADIVINLAGAGIADSRWTPARKQRIIDSRVQSAQLLLDTFQRLNHMPKAYLSAAGVGYYGNAGEDWVNEYDAPADSSFLVECCLAWEKAAEKIGAAGIRTVIFRTGIVLDKSGGALREIIKPLRFGLGAYFGDGQAWYSWIALEDICRMFQWAAETPDIEGVYNAVAPHPARNFDLVKATASAMKQAAIFAPVPAFALRLLFGEMADTILFSTRVSAEKIIQAGFHFQYPVLDAALAHIFAKNS